MYKNLNIHSNNKLTEHNTHMADLELIKLDQNAPSIDLEFIVSYMINTEQCELLATYMYDHDDNLDTEFNIPGLNSVYNISGHLGVLVYFQYSDNVHLNIKKYCHLYGNFNTTNITKYINSMSNVNIKIMIKAFIVEKNLPYSYHLYMDAQDIINNLYMYTDKLHVT
jgi:hypothetical protein